MERKIKLGSLPPFGNKGQDSNWIKVAAHLSRESLLPILLNESFDGLVADVLDRAVGQQLVPDPWRMLDGGSPDRRLGRVEDHVPVRDPVTVGLSEHRRFGRPPVPTHLFAIGQVETRSGLEKGSGSSLGLK